MTTADLAVKFGSLSEGLMTRPGKALYHKANGLLARPGLKQQEQTQYKLKGLLLQAWYIFFSTKWMCNSLQFETLLTSGKTALAIFYHYRTVLASRPTAQKSQFINVFLQQLLPAKL